MKKFRGFANFVFLVLFVFLDVIYAEENPSKITWVQVKQLPRGLEYDALLEGYLSVFEMDGFWHVYFYDSRSSLNDHVMGSYIKIGFEELTKMLKINQSDPEFFRCLDQRHVRIHGRFLSPDYGSYEHASEILSSISIEWRDSQGKWTNSRDVCLEIDARTPGKKLYFSRANFSLGKAEGKAEGVSP